MGPRMSAALFFWQLVGVLIICLCIAAILLLCGFRPEGVDQ